MMNNIKIGYTKHDSELASIIWPSFKETLVEKHGHNGAMGDKGEQQALELILTGQAFAGAKWAVSCQDCLLQMMGSDIVMFDGNKYYFIDVKHGSSNLYYDKDQGGKYGWYFTARAEVLNKLNKTDIIMHLGPKGDVYAWYFKAQMQKLLKLTGRAEKRIYFNDWFNYDVRTNI